MSTKIKQQELKIYPSEKLTDTDDGGGLRTGTALTGAENELFPPLSGVDVTMGDFAMRLVYAGIDRRDNEPLLGGNFIIATPPDAPNVSFLAFAAAYSGELRDSAINRVESYSVKTIESRMTLMSIQQQGARLVVAYQLVEEPLPKVGETYCLDQNTEGFPVQEQYFKIARVEDEVRQIYHDLTGDYFERRVIRMETTEPLKYTFTGYDGISITKVEVPCLIRETMVADAGRYFGVKRLANNALKGKNIVTVDSIFEKIVPTSSVTTPFADRSAANALAGLVDSQPTGGEEIGLITRYRSSNYSFPAYLGDIVYLGTAITPGSLRFYSSEKDDGKGFLRQTRDNKVTAKINYHEGSLEFVTTSYWDFSSCKFKPAARPVQLSDSAAIYIDETNQSLTHIITLTPPPLLGSLVVSYRAQGDWYELYDDGTGTLAGTDAKYGSGQLDSASGTVTLTTGALPDVNSEIIFTWVTPATYFKSSQVTLAKPTYTFQLENEGLAPNTVSVKFFNGTTTEVAADNGFGFLSSDNFLGAVDYAKGLVHIQPKKLPPIGAQYEFSYSYGDPLSKTFNGPAYGADGTVALDLEQTHVTPGTVRLRIDMELETFDYYSLVPGHLQSHGKIPNTLNLFDRDGDGHLRAADGTVFGSITYATGIISITPRQTVKIPAATYQSTVVGRSPLGYGGSAGSAGARYAATFTYFPSPPVAPPSTPWVRPSSSSSSSSSSPVSLSAPTGGSSSSSGSSSSGSGSSKPKPPPLYRIRLSGTRWEDALIAMPANGTIDVTYNAGSSPNSHTETHTGGGLEIDLTPLYKQNIIERSVVFKLGEDIYYDRGGKLYYRHNPKSNIGILAGSIHYADGIATISAWEPGDPADAELCSLLTTTDKNPVDEVVFRVPAAPVQPRSLQIRGSTLQGQTFNVTADADGKLQDASVFGTIDYATGVVRVRFGQWLNAAGHENELWFDANAVIDGRIFKSVPVYADSLSYNAVSVSYLPVDGSVIGIDASRLPADGQVPIYRVGDMAVIAARYQQDLGTAFTAGQTIQLNVTDLDGLCLVDKNKTHVLAEHYTYDLSAGTITFATPLDLSAYTLPLTVYYAQEEEKAITHVDINGQLTLASPLRRSYDKANSYVSSAMIGGDMQVRVSRPFAQQTWTNQWEDTPIGAPVLERLNVKDYPIELFDDTTVTDRWAIVFQTGTQFRLYSERLGLVAEQDILTDLAPLNPANNRPYFRLRKQAFGATDNVSWPVGRVIRFNTFGAVIMPWIIRAVQRGDNAQTSADGFTMSLRGNTVIE